MHLAVHERRGRASERRCAARVTLRPPARPEADAQALSKTGRRARSGRRSSSAISASSSRPILPKDSRESTSCRSSAGATPAHVNRAVIVWCDDVLRSQPVGPPRAARTPRTSRRSAIARRAAPLSGDGWRLLGLSWQPDVAEGTRRGGRRGGVRADERAPGRGDRGRVLSARRRSAASAGAGSRCPDWACCSSIATDSIRRNASTSAPARRIPASRAGSDSCIAMRTISFAPSKPE